MNKELSIWMRFEILFMFIDLKVILLVTMLVNFYKETLYLTNIVDAKLKMPVIDVLNHVWQKAGSGYVFWIIAAALLDIVIKKILRSMNE